MSFRKPRIAWSVFLGLACVLLIVLWVRSYWWIDQVYVGRSYPAVCGWGKFYYKPILYYDNGYPLHITTHRIGPILTSSTWNSDGPLVFKIVGIGVPIWLVLVPMAAFAVVPWLRWRFRLRTLLTATTLIGVILGLIVYAANHWPAN